MLINFCHLLIKKYCLLISAILIFVNYNCFANFIETDNIYSYKLLSNSYLSNRNQSNEALQNEYSKNNYDKIFLAKMGQSFEKLGTRFDNVDKISNILNLNHIKCHKNSFDSYVQSNEKRFEDFEVAIVDLEQHLVIHDANSDELTQNNLANSSEIIDSNVQLIIEDK